jgi:ornithine decarboxylase
MSRHPAIWPSPAEALRAETPDHPVLFFSPSVLQATYRLFRDGFPGLVTFAVKANDARMVLENLVAAGMTAFDVASPVEMRKVRAVLPGAVLHYNNPVRSQAEIAEAVALGVASYSVDCESELAKLARAACRRGPRCRRDCGCRWRARSMISARSSGRTRGLRGPAAGDRRGGASRPR